MSKKDRDTQTIGSDDVGTVEDNALARAADGEVIGALAPAELDDFFSESSGFTNVKTVKIGDPRNGGIPGFAGAIIAKGEAIETQLPDSKTTGEVGYMPTFFAHPAKMLKSADGRIKFRIFKNVTMRLVAAHQTAGDLDGLLKLKDAGQATGCFATRWNEKKPIKGGSRQVNDYDYFYEKPENVAEDAAPASAQTTG